jgi:acyl carrier protein
MTIIADEVVELVAIQLGATGLRPGDRFQEDLDAESADILNIVAAVEDRWGITIDEEELVALRTVSDLVRLVQQRAGQP